MERRKFLMILAAAVVLVVVGGAAYALTGNARRGTAVAASVNGEPIYWSQVDAEMKRTAATFGVDPNSPEFEKQKKDLEKAVIDQIIVGRIVMQEARKRNIVVPEGDIDEQIDTIRKRFPSPEEFDSAMQRNGFTAASLRDAIRLSLTQRKLAEVVAPVTVTDDEVRKQFSANRSQYDKPEQRRLSHILFAIREKGMESVAQAKARIVQARLDDGDKFEDLAKQYSDDPGSAQRGGELGFVGRGSLVKEFEDAAWAMKPGGTSGLVRTQYGLHIIRLHEIRAAEKGDFEKLKGQIREQIAGERRGKAFEAWVEQQRKAAKIERFERR
jgi:parvulin-like peptidyl-prolyl isomerase